MVSVTNTFNSGVNTSFSSELNTNFTDLQDAAPFVTEIYTGTGFNSAITNGGTDEQSYELTAISAATIGTKNYLKIKIMCNTVAAPGNTSTLPIAVSAKIQTKDIGGSYSDSLGYVTLQSIVDTALAGNTFYEFRVIEYIHTLTVDEKANGVQVQIFSKCTGPVNAGTDASFTNVQTSIELME